MAVRFMDGSLLRGKIAADLARGSGRDLQPAGAGAIMEHAMPFGTDFVLGPFLVARDGKLSPRDPDNLKGFSVRWRGCSVHARLLLDGKLAFRANLGRVPSTAGAARALREPLFAVMRNLPATLPRAWTLNLLADHRIELASEEPLDLPASAVDLISVIIQFLLALAPYLDLMEEVGIAGPAALSSGPAELGMAKI